MRGCLNEMEGEEVANAKENGGRMKKYKKGMALYWKYLNIWLDVSVYKGRLYESEHENYRGIIILSIPWKLYDSVLISWLTARVMERVVEEQRCFRSDRGFVDEIFV